MDDNGSIRGVILSGDLDVAGSVEWDTCPDLLLPLANTPLVERILTEYARAGIRETLIAAGRYTPEIAALCGDGARWDLTLSYQDARDEQNLRERVGALAAFTKNAPFLVTTGPLLLESENYACLVQSYRESRPGGIRAVRPALNTTGTPGSANGSSGDVDGASGNADGGLSIYLMTPRIYEVLNGSGPRYESPESLFDEALEVLARRGETVLNLDVDHLAFGISTPEAYLASNERLLASVSGSMKTEMPKIMDDNFSSPNLVLRPPVMIDATAELERCHIGPDVCIGPGVRLGHGAAIEHSVIMDGADVGDGASISFAVIGKNASIGNRSVLHGRPDQVRVVRSV